MEHASLRLDPQTQSWMCAPGLVSLMKVIQNAGGEARIVGGAIRNALLGKPVEDVDLAINLSPEKASERLFAAGFKIIPIGYDHGTIMAIADGKGYEITTLRRDVSTDGRHAEVVFTKDWCEDAARRDFTMNALYADFNGQIYDYFGGLEDLKARRLRFIGDPEQRIREDYLRILRYFRFLAQIDGTDSPAIDISSLKACRLLAPFLISLSGERLWREILRLLMCANPVPSLNLAISNDIFKVLLPDLRNNDRLDALIQMESWIASPDPIRRLAALWMGPAEMLFERLRFSRSEMDRLKGIVSAMDCMRQISDRLVFRKFLYDVGADNARDALMLVMAEGQTDKESLVQYWREWENPVFPIKGKDILSLGLNQGPDVGDLLLRVKDWWCATDFQADREACLQQARHIVNER